MVRFVEETHKYYDENDKELISVTTLLKKHNLSPNYDNVDVETLKKASEYGKLVHSELEDYIKKGILGMSTEVENFSKWTIGKDISNWKSETMVYDDLLAGQIDLIMEDTIADFKTTYQVHKDSISWQLSLYKYLYEKQFNCEGKFTKALCIHLRGDKFEVIEIPFKSRELVDKLLQCEYNSEVFELTPICDNKVLQTISDLLSKKEYYESQVKRIENEYNDLKKVIMDSMNKNGIIRFENEDIIISLVSPKPSVSIDVSKLEADIPNAKKLYGKTIVKKPYVLITAKGER